MGALPPLQSQAGSVDSKNAIWSAGEAATVHSNLVYFHPGDLGWTGKTTDQSSG